MDIFQPKERLSYQFSNSFKDDEILEDSYLNLSSDKSTWLYTVDSNHKNSSKTTNEQTTTQHDVQSSKNGGKVDSRTFTRRKLCSLRPSLESVVESPLFNRSSLGIHSDSFLLNDQLVSMRTPESTNQDKNSLNFTDSDKNCLTRTFKLDGPLTNFSPFLPTCNSFGRQRYNSEMSDISVPSSIENGSLFEQKNCQITDSLVLFLQKVDDGLTVAEPTENQINDHPQQSPAVTQSPDNSLEAVNCKPPNGFRDNEMSESILNVYEVDGLDDSKMTNSVHAYLENGRTKSTHIKSPNETENIPPYNRNSVVNTIQNIGDSIKNMSVKNEENTFLNSTFILEKNTTYDTINGPVAAKTMKIEDGNLKENQTLNSTFQVQIYGSYDKCKSTIADLDLECENGLQRKVTLTNNVNILRENTDSSGLKKDIGSPKLLNRTYEKEISEVREMREINGHGPGHYKSPTIRRAIPSRNATFNSTFTKLLQNKAHEDDCASSASDSSLSSKPTSVEELRTIAQQQETRLVGETTSTPTNSSVILPGFGELDIELSPIRSRLSRSANSSPARQPQLEGSGLWHPSTPPMPPAVTNTTRRVISRLKTPKPVSRLARPVSAAVSSVIIAPRSQVSRLPLLRPRGSGTGIPGPKRGQH